MGTGGIPPVTLSDWQPTFYMESRIITQESVA